MSDSDRPASDSHPHRVNNKNIQASQPKSCKVEKKEDCSTMIGERRLLVWGVLFLSILGVVAFLVTGQVAVVIAMNAPLLAIIGKDYFLR